MFVSHSSNSGKKSTPKLRPKVYFLPKVGVYTVRLIFLLKNRRKRTRFKTSEVRRNFEVPLSKFFGTLLNVHYPNCGRPNCGRHNCGNYPNSCRFFGQVKKTIRILMGITEKTRKEKVVLEQIVLTTVVSLDSAVIYGWAKHHRIEPIKTTCENL